MSISRRDLTKSGVATLAVSASLPTLAAHSQTPDTVERWGIFEAAFHGPSSGNPFIDVEFSAVFKQADQTITVPGFYDGDGIYRIRFMPPTTGPWIYRTVANHQTLDGRSGQFSVAPASPSNHGPVRVRDKYGLVYADGLQYREIGTTCYAWACQSEQLQAQTLKTLAAAPFNKLRMGLFPKWFVYNRVEPPLYPFEGSAPAHWDFTRFNPAYFQNLDRRIGQLRDLGIEADLILFHPYDDGHWGFDNMGTDGDSRYVRYVVARFGAYRNVWWSLANEWDYFKTKSEADFVRIGETIAKTDAFNHLCSIHNQKKFFDHGRPWISHLSVQNDMADNASLYIQQYGKPVVFDECRYEGNISEGWGDINPDRMVGMFWKTHVSGAFCGHGETYLNDREELWWSKGGVLVGQSPKRIAFFKRIIDAAPAAAIPLPQRNTWGVDGQYYLTYLWDRQHAVQSYKLPEDARFRADIIDTVAMTIWPVPGLHSGNVDIALPIKPYLAIRMMRV